MRLWNAFGPIISLFLKERRGMLLAGALLAAATVLAGIALLGVSGWFITATAIAGASAATALVFDVFAPAAAIRFLSLARTASRYGERLTTHEATLSVLAGLREQLFRKSSQPSTTNSLSLQPSRTLFRLTADIDALDSFYLRILVPAAVALGTAIVVLVVFGTMHLLFGLTVTAWLLVAGFGIPILAARWSAQPARRRAHGLEALRSRTIDVVAGQTDLAMAGQLRAYRQTALAADTRLATADDALNIIESKVIAGFGIASAILLGAVLYGAVHLVEGGDIKVPIAVLGILVSLAALEPFAGLRRGAVELGRTVLAARRLGPGLVSASPPLPFQAPTEDMAIELKNVSIRFGASPLPSLQDVSFVLEHGERLAITGASGAGKTTLLALLAGEVEAESGDVKYLPATLLTQRTELFQDSLRDNLLLAAPGTNDDRLLEVLAIAGLAEFIEASPDGLNTRLGEGGIGLSGGQARRLALARLLLRNAPLWLLDEPSEGIDGETARDVLKRLADQMAQHTVIIATHIRREAELADRLLVLERGHVKASLHRGQPEYHAFLESLRPD
ncbi:ATP-binding cassette domain-containing protein [Phyllobacterium sp. YR531]|uniref:amino acid ABC transporter ATP-binding/permease protein n=1 Tax=Phyllobacterium sp. YR531 TaxID=1144343 RepID=UPI00026FB2A9|nr:ATP-binding cassette domain-containing protein [Phyllobacterium sp. YR531]EJN00452.1 fused ATPase/permease component of ABC-type transporter involved in cytochrome bd biogenesis [Phyllobacterium sp. YR531]